MIPAVAARPFALKQTYTKAPQDMLANVTRPASTATGTKRKLSLGQTDASKKQTTASLSGDEDACKSGHSSDVDMKQVNEGDDDLDSDEDCFGHPDGTDDEDEYEDDEGDYDEFEEFQWLKSLNISIKANDAADSPQVGYCTAKIIDREQIRASFHRDMEEPSNDTATMGFSVFDRWGCLKSEFLNHPVKKGSGVWGPELNDGRILLIETLSIQDEYQRKGYGTKLFHQIWDKAQSLSSQEENKRRADRKKSFERGWEDTQTAGEQPKKIDDEYLDSMDKIFRLGQKTPSGCDFAVIWATVLNTRAVEAESEKLTPTQKQLFYQKKQSIQEDFWRAMGFRRIGSSSYFCLAKDPKHASHLLTPQDDYKRPAALRVSARTDGQDFPLMDPIPDPHAFEQKNWSDSETKKLMEARLVSYPPTDPMWVSTDRHNNNILHILARGHKAESLTWILAMPFADALRWARNLEGETPLEALESELESNRTWKQVNAAQVVMSDIFPGFTPSQVECLRLLKNLKYPSSDEIMRLAFGCTCNQCLGGFLSPRNVFAILCQAEINHDMLNDDLDVGDMSGADWCEWSEHMFEHLAPSVRNNLQTNKSLRQGFTNIFGYVAETLRANRLPKTDAVLEYAAGEWPPHVKNFLQRGGTVHAVVQACFDCAINNDIYLGSGEHEACFQKDIDALPTCRNDREFVFARRQCRRLEGLPDEIDPRVGMGGIW